MNRIAVPQDAEICRFFSGLINGMQISFLVNATLFCFSKEFVGSSK